MIQKSQSGFTLIELVIVIVLLGILGVTALGKFQNLSTNAEEAAAAGVASELSASSSINYANSLIGNTPAQPINDSTAGTLAAACEEAILKGLFATNIFPAAYTSEAGVVISTASGDNDVCNARGDSFTCKIVSILDTSVEAQANMLCTAG